MAFPFQKLPMSKILAFTIVCIAMQPSFLLPQGIGKSEFEGDRRIENISASVTGKEAQPVLQQTRDVSDSTTHNDSGSCFLYFVSQDVNSLLNQARRMLSRSTTERQRSWLILYLHNLESLSRKLRQLPAENRNRCFQIRERLESMGPDSKDLSSAPNEVQLRFAKKLFMASHQHPNTYRLSNGRLNEHVTGTISTGPSDNAKPFEDRAEMPLGTNVKSSQNHAAYIAHQQSNKYNENNSKNVEPSGKLDVGPDVGSSSFPQSVSKQDLVSSTNFPITHRDRMNMAFEAMPFIPRVTRKIPPISMEQTMRFRAFSGHGRSTHLTTEEKHDDIQTHNPITFHVQSSTQLAERVDESTTANAMSSEEHHPELYHAPSTQQYEESSGRVDHKLNPAALLNRDFKASYPEKSTEKTTEYFDNDDDLVIQLHSEGKYVAAPSEKMHPRLLKNTRPIKTVPSITPSAPTASSSEAESVQNEHQSHENPVGKNGNVDIEPITGTSSNNENLAAMPVQNENDLDFDYEEQGAAAGELFIDDDVISTKYLTVAPSVENTASKDDDEVVRQLDQLKFLKADTIPTNNPIPKSEVAPAAVPTEQHNVGFNGVHRLMVNNK